MTDFLNLDAPDALKGDLVYLRVLEKLLGPVGSSGGP